MSPITNVSDIVRIPRIGKIRLGMKVTPGGDKPSYPKPVDHFVCPPEVEEVFGEKPKELQIMSPVEDPDQFAQQWLRRYSISQGLTCIGDGETCRRKVDAQTGDFASHTTELWHWAEGCICNHELCPEYINKRCRRVLNLQFLMPDVPGLGVWQIDTSSFYSIVNINSMIKLLKGIFGRCSMLPLTLALGEIEVSPLGIKKKKVYIMHIRQDNVRLSQLARMSLAPASHALLEAPDGFEIPDDLFPDEILADHPEAPQGSQLTKKRTGRKRQPKAEKVEPPPDYLDPRLQQVWQHIRDFLKQEGHPELEHIQKWFEDHYQMDVTGEELQQQYYPEHFTRQLLGHLHESLIAYFDMRRK